MPILMMRSDAGAEGVPELPGGATACIRDGSDGNSLADFAMEANVFRHSDEYASYVSLVTILPVETSHQEQQHEF
jgi:hypothetical protein